MIHGICNLNNANFLKVSFVLNWSQRNISYSLVGLFTMKWTTENNSSILNKRSKIQHTHTTHSLTGYHLFNSFMPMCCVMFFRYLFRRRDPWRDAYIKQRTITQTHTHTHTGRDQSVYYSRYLPTSEEPQHALI